MIQVLTYDGKNKDFFGENVVIHKFHDARALAGRIRVCNICEL